MSEEKTVRQLERELANARAKEYTERENAIVKNRDFSVVGIDKDTTVEKKIPDASGIPDVILLPKRQKNRKENNPF